MRRKFELSIDVNYVKSWGIKEALREYFQNSYDEEEENPKNKSFYEYDKDKMILRIGNKLSVLKAETLLLGCTSKNDNKNTIGQFGEGYKIATVVALRTGHDVTIYNYGAREVWTTKLVKSRKYGGRLVPTFYIDTEFDWTSFFKKSKNSEEKNLIIEIANISPDEYQEAVDTNLHLWKDYPKCIETSFGNILIDKQRAGEVYVSGLYVYDNNITEYGYDIKPAYLQLDRDRMAVSNFDLKWVTSKMWLEAAVTGKVDISEFFGLLETDSEDISYIDSTLRFINSDMNKVVEGIYKAFIEKYGKVIPVDSEEMKRKLKLSDNDVAYVSSSLYYVLKQYSGEDTVVQKTETYYQRYSKLLKSLEEFMTDEQKEEAKYLLENTKWCLGGDGE